jgi:hypothetical protein
MGKIMKLSFAVICIVLIVAAVLSVAGDNKSSSNSEDTINTRQSKEAVKGEDLMVGNIRWKLLGSQETDTLYKEFSGTAVTTQNKYIVVQVEVENKSNDMKSVSDLELIDSNGRKYTSTNQGFKLDIPQMFILENLNPSIVFTFSSVYEVPKDAAGFYLSVGDLEFTGSDEGRLVL